MPLSRRSAPDDQPNAVTLARARAEAAGIRLTDLSDSNPTHHGLFDPAIADAVAHSAARATHYDPDPRGPQRAREALAARFGGSPSDYWLTAGTSQAYDWLFSLLADPGDAVAIPRPGYPLVDPLARLAGVGTVGYPAYYLHPHGWEYDADALAVTLGDPVVKMGDDPHTPARRAARLPSIMAGSAAPCGTRVKAVVAVNPNNPTGAYADAALADVCAARGVPLIADEVFAPFVLDAAPPSDNAAPACLVPHLADATDALTFTLDGVSKLLAAPQLKLGWIRISGPPDDVARTAPVLDRIADAYLPVSGPVADALPALLDLADAAVARVRDRLLANLATTRRYFADAPYRVRRCDGGWTVLVDVPRVLDDDALAIALLRRGLSVHPGWFYDLDSLGTLALSLLPRPDAFADGCRRLSDAIDGLTRT